MHLIIANRVPIIAAVNLHNFNKTYQINVLVQ